MRSNNAVMRRNVRWFCAGFCASEGVLTMVGEKVVYEAADRSRAASTKGVPVQQ